MSKFSVGNRVQRPVDVFNSGSELMKGTVVRVYSEPAKPGYLPHGLDHEGLLTIGDKIDGK